MAKLKLKVVLVPIQFSDVPSSNLDSSQSRRFLHLADADSDLGKVCDGLTKRYAKLYPDDDKLAIMSLQDDDRCDLDPDFEAGDVLNSGDIIRVIVENELQNLSNHTSFNQLLMMAAENTPAVMRLVDLNKQTQSTPIYPPAPVLTQDSTFPTSSRKRTKEYFDLTDTNIPSKHTRRTVWSSRNESFIEPKVPAIPLTPQLNVSKKRKNNSSPPKTQNLDIEDINETNISLPPPEIGEDHSIPQKKSSSTKPKEEALPGKKRITSGMLSMPAHAQLEKEEIHHHKPKLSKRSKHYLYSRALYSDMGGSETTSSDLDTDEISLDFKDKSLEIGVENISKNDDVEDRPLASLYEETIKNSPNNQEETLTKTEIMNLFKNGMKIPARLQNKSQNESARSRNLSALMKNLEIDMVDKNPVLSSEEKRATRAAANRKTRTALKKAQTSKVANTNMKDSNLMTSLSGSRKGSHSKSSEPKSSEPKASEPKTSEPKTSEPKTSEPKTSEPKTSEPNTLEPKTSDPNTSELKSPKSKSSETKGADLKSPDGKISDPKDSDPRHAIKYISNPTELLNSLKSVSAFNKEAANKNTNGVPSSHNNKTISDPKDTRTKDSVKNIKKADPNDNKKAKQTESKHEVIDKTRVKETAPSINTDSSNDKQLKEENGQEIKPHYPPEGFQPSFTDLAGTSKLGALFEKMKQFDEKLNVLNKKGRYNTKQLSQRDSDNIESSTLHKDRIAEPQINTTKLISSPKNATNTNINEAHSTPTKEEQTTNSVQIVKPQSSNESKNIQSEHNDVLPTTTQDQQMGNLGIYANLNSYPISYNNITSNSHLANNTSDRNNSSTLNKLLGEAETKNIFNNVNSPMSKSNNNKNIPNTVNNIISKANDNSISKSNDKEIPSTVNNTMSKANDKNTSITMNNSISKSNYKDMPSTVNNPMSEANNKGTFNNFNGTISKASDKSMSNNMNKAVRENDNVSNNISTPMNKTNDNVIPNYMGNTMGKQIHNNISHNMNNVVGKVNYNDIHNNKHIAMSNHNLGILKNVIGDTSKIPSLNDKMSNNNNMLLVNTNGATKITGINHIEDKTSEHGKSIVSSNTIKYPYVKSNVTNGTEKTKEFLRNKHLPHSTPNDYRIQKRVQNVYTSPYDPSKLTNDKVNNFDFKQRNLSTNTNSLVSGSGNDIDTIVFSATNGYNNPKGFPSQEKFQSFNLQKLETTRQDSNHARDNNSNSNPNNNIRNDGQVPPITKNTSNQLHRADKNDDSKFKDLFMRVDSKLPNSAGTNTLSPEKLKSPSTPTKPNTPVKLAKIHGITLTNSSLSLNVAGISRFAECRNKHPVDYANVSSIAKQPNEHERIKLRAESIKSNPFILDVLPLQSGEALSKEDAKREAEDSTKQKKLGLNKRKHNVSYSNISSSSSSDESPSSESENNDSDVENKRPRLAAAVPSSTFSHPNVLHQNQSIFSPASKEKELLQTRKGDGSHTSATKVLQESPQKTPETPSSYQDKSNIKKPILTSLSDLALRGVPDVESTSMVDLGTKDIKKTKDDTTDGETTDEVGSSSSSSATDSEDSDSDQDTSGKFINIKKLNKGKPKRNKGGFSALMKDARKF